MPNPEEATPEVPVGPAPKSANLIVKLAVLAAIAVIVGGVVLFLKQTNLFPFSKTPTLLTTTPTITPTPISTPTLPPPNLLFCNIQKEDNPLVSNITNVLPNLREIDFSGNVFKAIFEQDTATATITLVSFDGQQTAEFTVPQAETVYGKTEQKIADLKPLDNVLLAYNCNPSDPKKTAELTLSRIYKISKDP